MRTLILSALTFYLSTFLLCSCHSQKQVQTDVAENVSLSKTTAAISADSAVLNMVSSWSCDFDSLDVTFMPRDTASAASVVRLKARRLSVKRDNALRNEQHSVTAVSDTLASHRTSSAHNRETMTKTYVYKPPNATLVIIIVSALCFLSYILDYASNETAKAV